MTGKKYPGQHYTRMQMSLTIELAAHVYVIHTGTRNLIIIIVHRHKEATACTVLLYEGHITLKAISVL